jgi:S-adenosylmethionine-diacylglycerol 3-amino-3-carboxypropyl transferase
MRKEYFKALNYTIGNEDPALELSIMPENADHVFAVAGSGSRVTPLFAKAPRYVTCVDSSIEQLSLAELRITSIKSLDHREFLGFWGYPLENMSAKERKKIFENLGLSAKARKVNSLLFEQNSWRPILYLGRWERTFKKLSVINRAIVGKRALKLFDFHTKSEHDNYLQTQFPHKAWATSIFLLGNSRVFNFLLYKGNFPKKNITKSMYCFYKEAFQKLFSRNLVRTNFLLQLLFFGELKFQEGLPLECNHEMFYKAKMGIQKAEIKYIHGDIMNEVKRTQPKIDFLSFSDIASYFHPPLEQSFLQDIKTSLSPGAIVVNRYYLRIPEDLNINEYKNVTDSFFEAIMNEKTQMYHFGIYKKFEI